MGAATPREYWFPLLLAAFMLVLGTLPFAYGYLSAGDDQVYMGLLGNNTTGGNGYLMLARQAKEGAWLFQNRMTPEPTPRAYFDLEWFLFGRMARHFNLPLMAVFHIWRVITVLCFMFAGYYLAVQCFETISTRRLALSLLVFGTGFGWLIWVLNRLPFLDFPLSLDMQGVTIFGYLINKPHFIRAALFLLLQAAFLIRGETTRKWRYFVLSGLAATGLIFIRFHHLPESYMLFVGTPIIFCFLEKRIDLNRIARYGIACVTLLPAALYVAYSLYANVMGVSSTYWPGPLWGGQVFWLGLPFLLCCWYLLTYGIVQAYTARKAAVILGFWLLGSWMLAAFHHFLNAGHEIAALALLIAPCFLVLMRPLPALLEALKNHVPPLRKALPNAPLVGWSAIALVLFCSLTSGYVYGRMFKDLHNPVLMELYYLDRDTYDALQWIAREGHENEVVLASYVTSQYVAGQTNKRIVTGHDLLTQNDAENHSLVIRFLHEGGDDGFKRYVVKRFGVQYVLFSPFEQMNNHFYPANHPWLEEVFRQGATAVYKVNHRLL